MSYRAELVARAIQIATKAERDRISERALAHLERFIDFTGPRPMYVTANGVRQEMPSRLEADARALRAVLAPDPKP